MKTVLVTGATGFVGASLVNALHEKFIVNVLLRKQTEGLWNKAFITNLEHQDMTKEVVKDIDIVFHLAGVAHDTRLGIESLYHKVNTQSTLKLAELAAINGVKKFVFVSSVKAGGSPGSGICADENINTKPDGIYGETKREAEIKLLEIGKATGMHVSIIRPSLVYGPGVKGNLRIMLKGISKGWFPPLPETHNRRSMVYLYDLVKAIQLVAEKDEANGEIFIVTDGEVYSTRKIFNEMCLAVGREIPRWSVPKSFFYFLAKTGDILNRYINFPFDTYRLNKLFGDDCYKSEKIREKLGFKSEMTLKDALSEMAEINN